MGIKQEARRREKASVRRRERGGVVMAKPPEEGERGSGGDGSCSLSVDSVHATGHVDVGAISGADSDKPLFFFPTIVYSNFVVKTIPRVDFHNKFILKGKYRRRRRVEPSLLLI